jgi:GTP cyclohydrolase II
MNHLPRCDQPATSNAPLSAPAQAEAQPMPDAGVLRLRAVHRAVADLRRGTPVVLIGSNNLVLIPAETAGSRGLGELAALAKSPPILLLAASRAAALLPPSTLPIARRPADVTAQAFHLPPALLAPASLRSLADPSSEQLLPQPPVPADVPASAAAALALVKLARLLPAAVVAETHEDVCLTADQLGLLTVSIEDVLAYPNAIAANLVRVAEAEVPLEHAPDARVVAFRAPDSGIEHLAILVGRPEASATPLVRMHSECFTGDLLGSLRCDCGPQLRGAIERMATEGAGVLLYLAQEGRGIGLVNKLRAYALQDRGLDTLDANRALGWGVDERNFLVAATMLDQLGIASIRLLTNNPDKVAALVACGIDVVAREGHVFAPNGVNDHYLATKAKRFGHLL